jgi:hypothetical protein
MPSGHAQSLSNEIRHIVGQRTLAEVTIAYKICQSCLEEKAVFALRASA